jgi:hypothetical protein
MTGWAPLNRQGRHFFACTGDIMDLRANVTHLWMAGHEVSLESRHTRLYEKYRNRPKPH